MSYREILSESIEKSGLTLKEISILCKDQGVKITESYISQLRSGKLTSPSIDISQALSKVLNIHPDILVLESYLDKAPEALNEFLRRVRFFHNYDKLLYSQDEIEDRVKMNEKTIAFIEELDQEPYSKFITSINESDKMKTAIHHALVSSHYFNCVNMIDLDEKMKSHPDVSFDEIISITKHKPINYESAIVDVEDDSLEPLISKGSIVVIDEKKYMQGDLIHFWDDNKQDFLIRKYYADGDTIILVAPNSNYEPLLRSKSQVEILGKVTKYLAFLNFDVSLK